MAEKTSKEKCGMEPLPSFGPLSSPGTAATHPRSREVQPLVAVLLLEYFLDLASGISHSPVFSLNSPATLSFAGSFVSPDP